MGLLDAWYVVLQVAIAELMHISVEVGLYRWARFVSRVLGVVFCVAVAKLVHLSVAGRSLAHAGPSGTGRGHVAP